MGRRGSHPAKVVATAKDLVPDLPRMSARVAHDDLLALDDHHAVERARVVRTASTAPAQRLDLQHLDPVRQLDQTL